MKLTLLKSLNNLDIFNIFILGIASGLPLALVFSTLSIWLKELGLSKTTIGLFAFVSTPYTLKFLWSPLIDGIKLPYLYNKLGLRKSWLFLVQILLFISIFLFSKFSPLEHIFIIALLAFLVSFFSASQDIVIDAYRVELFRIEDQGIAASLFVYGYRIGMLISSAGALIIAEKFDFHFSYQIMAILFLLFAFNSFFLNQTKEQSREKYKGLENWLVQYVKNPFVDFKNNENFILILFFIILYKLGDAFAGIMTAPFILELGFTKVDIAFYVKTVGLIATLVGSILGALLVKAYNLPKALLIAGILQLITNLIFCAQAYIGKDHLFLALTISAENLAAGIGTIVFVAYISSLCNLKFSATQYALLSSVAAISRTWLSSSSGFIAEKINWIEFFAFSSLLALPALILLYFIRSKKI